MGQFGDLWVDEPDAITQIDALAPADLHSHLTEYVERGYTIFRNVVTPELLDQVVADTRGLFAEPERYVLKNAVNNPRAYVDPVGRSAFRKGDRVSDLFGISPAAREATFPPLIARFLHAIFQEPAIATQSISFEYGSQQAIHQDTAYVVSKKPTALAASWLALEDVEKGCGELIFYPGSHRFDHFLFSDHSKSWLPPRDGQDQHATFLKQLHEQAKSRGFSIERFLPKRGDILIWHSDLAHGGARNERPDATRRSLVTHFCPLSIKPNYSDRLADKYYEYKYDEQSYFTSAHYDMHDLLTQPSARILFDGGVTAARGKQPA